MYASEDCHSRWKKAIAKGRQSSNIFQASFFRGYVKLRGRTEDWSKGRVFLHESLLEHSINAHSPHVRRLDLKISQAYDPKLLQGWQKSNKRPKDTGKLLLQSIILKTDLRCKRKSRTSSQNSQYLPPVLFHIPMAEDFCLPQLEDYLSHHQSHGVPPSSWLQPWCHSLKFPKDLPILWTPSFWFFFFNEARGGIFGKSTTWNDTFFGDLHWDLHWDVVLPNLIEFQDVFTIWNVQLLATNKNSWNCDLRFTMTVSFAGGLLFNTQQMQLVFRNKMIWLDIIFNHVFYWIFSRLLPIKVASYSRRNYKHYKYIATSTRQGRSRNFNHQDAWTKVTNNSWEFWNAR